MTYILSPVLTVACEETALLGNATLGAIAIGLPLRRGGLRDDGQADEP